ncbi:MAG: protein-disulfide reductase DsbD domain-containing protein [Candidatus Binataceae bacterium]
MLLKDFQTGVGNSAAIVRTGDVTAKIVLSDARSFSGQRLGIAADFELSPGWHIYGNPLPGNYIATALTFDDEIVADQTLNFPAPTPLRFDALGETLPVYTGKFRAVGHILLKQRLQPGEYKLAGTLQFQECNDQVCKLPQSVRFEIPLQVDAMVPAAPKQ